MARRPARISPTISVFVILACACGAANFAFALGPDVPEWAKRVVWYQIFPERFRNGDPTNDPQAADLAGAWPHSIASGWRVSSWTSDWYALQPWEKAEGKDFYREVQERRYGGDLQGIIDKLDYLQNLGITALYLTPIFQSPSSHKYDASMYHHIDRSFGPDPEGDRKLCSQEDPSNPSTWTWTSADKLFLKLVKEAHRRGIKVVIDGVFNHVGETFWAFEDVRKNQAASRYKDWFTVRRWDDPATKEDEFSYDGWFGVKELPELRKDADGLAPGPRDHIHAVVRRWMDPEGNGNVESGVDGWRLDAADRVNLAFWRQFRTWVRGINPSAVLIGEVWWEDWANEKMFDASPWLKGDAFDGVMNYRWARETMRFFAGRKTAISPSEFARRLKSLRDDYPSESDFVLMNLLDSHDTDRLSSHILNGDLPYDKNVGLGDNRDYRIEKPGAYEVGIQKLTALFQMTYLGAPMVYYGDEVGMWGGDDPDCRKPMLWGDLKYEDEKSHPFGGSRPDDKNEVNAELHAWYTKLIHLRDAEVPLQLGSFDLLDANDAQGVLAYARSFNNERIIVLLNNSSSPQTVSVSPSGPTHWKSLLGNASYAAVNGLLTLSLGPKSGEILGVDKG